MKKLMNTSSSNLQFFMISKSKDHLTQIYYSVAILPCCECYKIQQYNLVKYEGDIQSSLGDPKLALGQPIKLKKESTG